MTVTYFAPWEEEKNGGVQCPWGVSCYPAVRTGSSNTRFFFFFFFTPPSGRGLVIPIFFPWVFFLGGHLPQTSGFRSAKEILAVSFATQRRAFILSDRNVFYTPRGGEQQRGLMPLGLFLFFLLSWSVAPDLRLVKTILAGKLCAFSVYSPEFS